jgi:hypothetical protein
MNEFIINVALLGTYLLAMLAVIRGALSANKIPERVPVRIPVRDSDR